MTSEPTATRSQRSSADPEEAGWDRSIGPVGTGARMVVGAALLIDVVHGHVTGGLRPLPWLLALVAFPCLVLTIQWTRALSDTGPLRATGPFGHVVNISIFIALYLTPSYAPALEATSDAALIFYGASMLLAAARGYAGYEVLAISNWLLARDDQVGCVVFAPVDLIEDRTRST